MTTMHPVEETRARFDEGLGAAMMAGVAPSVVQVRSGRRGAGAGFIWGSDGLVMTNNHVVAGSESPRVLLTDGRSFDAQVVDTSRRLDLAMLRLPATLPALLLGDSDALRVGELVFAVGHPWGRVGAVTVGIVSGLGEVERFGRGCRFVQSDAYLAPGNSGGPLVNARGEVVGVNAMIFGDLALAIPINIAGAWAMGDVRSLRRAYLGVRGQTVTLRNASHYRRQRMRETGVLVVDVRGESPAARAGLLVGDVLLTVAGEPVGNAELLPGALAQGAEASGTAPVRLGVLRGGRVVEVEVELKLQDQGRERGA